MISKTTEVKKVIRNGAYVPVLVTVWRFLFVPVFVVRVVNP